MANPGKTELGFFDDDFGYKELQAKVPSQEKMSFVAKVLMFVGSNALRYFGFPPEALETIERDLPTPPTKAQQLPK